MFRHVRIILTVAAALALVPALAQITVSPDVRDALSSGRARVIVELQLAEEFRPEGELSAAQVRAQRAAIADAQSEIMSTLAAGGARELRRSTTLPFLSLEIGSDELEALLGLTEFVRGIRLDDTSRLN